MLIMSTTDEGNKKNKPSITIYTDGACSGNPGIGGWAAILLYKTQIVNNCKKEYKKCISGMEEKTTNNKMELTAIIESLKLLKFPCKIELFTDSKYALDGATKWLNSWSENNWRCANKKTVKNIELWQKLSLYLKVHDITWHWVKGHADNDLNNEVDRLARNAFKDFK